MEYKHDITMGAISKITIQSTEYDVHDSRITGVDTMPTDNSGNVVTSGGVKTAIDASQVFVPGTGTSSAILKGVTNTASGQAAVVFGVGNAASGDCAHAEGYNNTASGDCAHAEGSTNTASEVQAHAEGYNTQAVGSRSHSEGENTVAQGSNSHAEGKGSTAKGSNSHAEGEDTYTNGSDSHAEGWGTRTNYKGEHAEGRYNLSISGVTLHTVGCGTSSTRKNAHAITIDGKHYIPGIGTYQGTESILPANQDLATIISGKAPTAHASSATTYGVGTTANYGHVKLATGDMNGASGADGVACGKNHTHSQYLTSSSSIPWSRITGKPTMPYCIYAYYDDLGSGWYGPHYGESLIRDLINGVCLGLIVYNNAEEGYNDYDFFVLGHLNEDENELIFRYAYNTQDSLVTRFITVGKNGEISKYTQTVVDGYYEELWPADGGGDDTADVS